MTSPILSTKLYIPIVRQEFVSRPRMIKRLNEGLQHKLTLISAPAGFGKTALVSQWLQQFTKAEQKITPTSLPHHSPARMAWFSLDESDNDFTRFFTYFITALQQIKPQIGHITQELLQASPQPSPETVMTHLINEIADSPTEFVLILDDYHIINTPAIHEALTFLLDHLPSQLHLILTTRTDPPFPLARLRARGQITEIRTDDLRFSLAEATIFLSDIMDIQVSPEDISALETRTEGWIAGIQLAAIAIQSHLSKQGVDDASTFIKAFTGSHRYIFDYLTDEVLGQQEPYIQDFLLKTSILKRLSASLCDALLINEAQKSASDQTVDHPPLTQLHSPAQTILEMLETANLFIIPLDHKRAWYRYHHLFADLLHHRLRQLYPALEPDLHRRASQWYEAAGFLPEAIEHALSAQDYERAAALIEQIAYEMTSRFEVYTLGRWIESLPEELVFNYPRIVDPYAMVLSLTNRFEEYGRYLDKAQQAGLANQDSQAGQSILAQVTIQKCVQAFFFGDFNTALKRIQQAQEKLPTYNLSLNRWDLTSIQGYSTLQWVGDVATAQTALLEAVQIAKREANAVGITFCASFLTNFYIVQGELHQALTAAEMALTAATQPDGSYLPSAAYPQALLGRLYYEWNQPDRAADYLLAAVNPLQNITGLTTDPLDTTLSLALLKQAQGNGEDAMSLIAQAEQHFQNIPISDAFRGRLAAIKVRLYLAQGNVEAAQAWANDLILPTANATVTEAIRPINVFSYLVWVRVQLAQKDFERAMPILKRLHLWAKTLQLNSFVLETAMLQALALAAQNSVDLALLYLQEALTLAAPQGHKRLFIDEGEPMISLLHQAARKSRSSNYIQLLLAAFDSGPSSTKTSPASLTLPSVESPAEISDQFSPYPLIEPLTKREQELLHLLATGLTNQEIATKLYIALSTVKRHNINIYGKLGVRNRTKAVAKARKLNLI